MLGALLAARPAGKPLSAEQLRGHVLGLFLAGNETTAAALSWAVVHGAHHPDEWAKVRDDPDRHTVPFLTESLRLTPAVWGIPRTPTKAGVDPHRRRSHHAGPAGPGGHRVPPRHQPRPDPLGRPAALRPVAP